MVVLGIDPGLAHLGLATVSLADSTVIELCMLETAPGDGKVSNEIHRRSSEVIDFLYPYFNSIDVKVACVEEMSFPRNSSAAAKIAWVWGIISTLAKLKHIPVLRARPQDVKEYLCGRKDASKEQVANKLRKIYKGKANFKKLLKDIPKSKQEHPYDALAVIQYFMDQDPIEQLRYLDKNLSKLDKYPDGIIV